MDFKKLNQELQPFIINEMTIHKSNESFDTFYNDCIERYLYKKERSRIKDPQEQYKKFPLLLYENVLNAQEYQNVLITNGSIEHVYKEHPEITLQDWKRFLGTFNPSTDICLPSNKSKTSQKYIYKCDGFGYVLNTFPRSQAQLVTMFKGSEGEINNWINNQIIKNQKDTK